MTDQQTRFSYWDNLKSLLIFLVVLAHYYGAGFVYGQSTAGLRIIPNAIYAFIYMVHMPLFVFVSGYFSKNTEKAREQAASQLLLPYIVFNAFCLIVDWLCLGGEFYNPVFYPYNHMWYLFALFLWRFFANDLIKIRHCFLYSLLFSLFCSAFTPGKDWTLMANAITFLPFFLLGMKTSPDHIQRIRKIPHWICGAILVMIFFATVFLLYRFDLRATQIGFYSRLFSPDKSGIPHLLVTVVRYVAAIAMGVCILNLIPEKSSRFTKIGRNSMTVFLLHNLPGVRNLLYILNPFKAAIPLSVLWWTVWSAVAVWISGTDRAMKAYNKTMNLIRVFVCKKV